MFSFSYDIFLKIHFQTFWKKSDGKEGKKWGLRLINCILIKRVEILANPCGFYEYWISFMW